MHMHECILSRENVCLQEHHKSEIAKIALSLLEQQQVLHANYVITDLYL